MFEVLDKHFCDLVKLSLVEKYTDRYPYISFHGGHHKHEIVYRQQKPPLS